MWEVKDGTEVIARGDNMLNYQQGTHFLSENEDALQYAVFNLPDGEIIDRHIHKKRNHSGYHPTHEYFLLWSGHLLVTFYNSEKVDIESKLLYPGDFFCQLNGGHGFKAHSPGALFIEVKHGPFTSSKDDKEKF